VTLDERIQALAMHLEVLTGVHQDFEKRTNERMAALAEAHQAYERRMTERMAALAEAHQAYERRMTEYAADVKDAIVRLTNIAAAHDDMLDDQEKRIEKLEG